MSTPEQDPEIFIARHMAKRSWLFAMPLLAIGVIFWGVSGLISVALALAIVVVNFGIGAAAITIGARIGGPNQASPNQASTALMGTVMAGFLLRLGVLTAVIVPIRGSVDILPFAVALLVTHLGLLITETRYVSASLAYPGLAPKTAPKSKTTPDPVPAGTVTP